ncbi:phosphopantothenoylcysteine decarboxylase domain-containing protein [Clostridium minihomine]|uniref:phosphopantothenoylcysteine decarboxylase domain-containing protein n=1 Tax=Clostridium minihomine TaxID=2045012 RepID=UPI000C788B50|nr:phosphopantothenoylcysteine decarboxylase [Clostridium minihomine]
MKIIITAGGTTEKIDPVRKIKNSATGTLGSLIAEAFVTRCGEKMEKIYYLCERGSVLPHLPCVEVVFTEGVEQAKDALSNLLTTQKIDAVIHSMAVSDYTVERLTTAEDLAGFLASKLFPLNGQQFTAKDALADYIAGCIRENDRLLDQNSKVGSNIQNLMLSMKQTPKLISLIKSLQPSVVLVGFKLLDGVEKQQLLDAGYGVLTKNSCDLVLANDQTEIKDGKHRGYLLAPDKSCVPFETKEEIAAGIADRVLNLIEARK